MKGGRTLSRARGRGRSSPKARSRSAIQNAPRFSAPLHPLLQLQQTIGNQAVGRLLQAKLKISQSGDKSEEEADRMADTVMRMAEPSPQAPEEITDEEIDQTVQPASLQRQEEKEGEEPETELVQRQDQPNEKEEGEDEILQTKASSSGPPSRTSNVQAGLHSLKGSGQPLSPTSRHFFESRFGVNFSQVRVHNNHQAAETAQALNTRAFTVGHNMVFGAGQHQPETSEGKRLLAHELTHVVQQRKTGPDSQRPGQFATSGVVQRKQPDKPNLNYARARRRNKRFAKRLEWETRLGEFKPAWATLWNTSHYDDFAEAVAAFQVSQGFKGKGVTDILGSRTWDRLRPIGEVVAAQSVAWEKSKEVCTIAAQERLTKGYRRATGKRLIPKSEKKTINYILQSFNLRNVEKKYRATGAAGVLVKLGLGEFVSESEIWDKQALKPGAALQVWGSRKLYERLKNGESIHPYGTAAVFVQYVGKNKMKVRHFDDTETWSKTRHEVWIGANLLSR